MIPMNETLRLIEARYSCRAYTDELPTKAELEAIAKAAVAAPSAMNRQGWRVIVVTNRQLIDEMEAEAMRVLAEADDKSAYERIMSRGGTMFYHAPCMIMVAIEKDTELDCGILCENIALAAASLGIQSVICGMAGIPFSTDKGASFEKQLGFPEGYKFGMAVLLGHEVAPGKAHEPDLAKISYID
jgi:nitroreductase